MELVNFDADANTATLKFSTRELRQIASVLSGVLNTFPDQDATVLGLDEAKLDVLNTDIHAIADQIGNLRAAR